MKTALETLYEHISSELIPSRQIVNIEIAMKEYAIAVIEEIINDPYSYQEQEWIGSDDRGGTAPGRIIKEEVQKLINKQ